MRKTNIKLSRNNERRIHKAGLANGIGKMWVIIGLGVSVANTRLLGPEQYGDLKFLVNLFALAVTLLTFGFFATGARLVARSDLTEKAPYLLGGLITIAITLSIIVSISLFIFSFFQNDIFNNSLGIYIRYFSPWLFVLIFKQFLTFTLQGKNRIYELSVFNIAPQILYLLAVFALNFLYARPFHSL